MPDEQSTLATVPGAGTGTQHADGTQVRVLVVDDEPSLAELLSSVLRGLVGADGRQRHRGD